MVDRRRSSILDKLEPQERLKQLRDYSNKVEVNPLVPPLRYYRSGLEMVRMANVYYNEGHLENAYVLYLKFMTLFLEKIRKHPDFNNVPIEVKVKNQAKLREILPRAEKLKQQLLDIYTDDYNHCVSELKQEREKQNDKSKKTEKNKVPDKPGGTKSFLIPDIVAATIPNDLDNVCYPDPDSSGVIAVPKVPPPSVAVSTVPPPIGHFGQPSIPLIDRSNKPSSTQVSFDSNILRTVVVPVKVMTLFQVMAQSNTFKNIETCGILAGKLEMNELTITHMILPKQKGTADSCVTMNEEELFDYQDQHNLITLGWIHTHPTQTAFLSSVDLHTHCPYQLLMPEAIAIVCSPKYNDTGFFHLTPTHGLQFISHCRKTGFHPHPTDPPLFLTAEHVRIENNAPLEVLDLRQQ